MVSATATPTSIHSIPPPQTPLTPAIPPTVPPSSVKIYNAVYSSVQVFECMIRGIAIMRRRTDSYVNATQILKVAGIDKGRRTKILEKEILPGKHEIVQGGYGKYQGTWIPLERGRELASQYGVAPLLAPLFDFIPTAQANQSLTSGIPGVRSVTPSHQRGSPFPPFQYNPALHSTPLQPPASSLSPAPILPGSALKLLNQGRAQGLFTPSTSSLPHNTTGIRTPQGTPSSSNHIGSPLLAAPSSPAPGTSLKRARSEANVAKSHSTNGATASDIVMADGTTAVINSPGQPPAKRARTEIELPPTQMPTFPITNIFPFPNVTSNGKQINGTRFDPVPRFATKTSGYRQLDRSTFLRNPKRAAALAAIQSTDDDANNVLRALGAAEPTLDKNAPDYDMVLDDQGHSALHLACSLARISVCEALVAHGADVRRGSFSGETALIRTVLSTHAYDNQTFNKILALLHSSLRTLDNSRRTVLHHIAHVAGVKGRAPIARYYLECVLMWIAQRENGDFKSILDIQDEHGDTALNIAARVGNRSLVKTLVDVGANCILPNKLGLRPGDFGVDGDDLLAPSAHDVLASLRGSSGVPAQKSEEVITEITTMIKALSDDFSVEIKDKHEALEQAQQRLRGSTRQLAEQRREIQSWQARCNELEETQQKIRNLQRAISEEEEFDWTGRTEWDGSPAIVETAGLPFEHKGINSTLAHLDLSLSEASNSSLEADPTLPVSDSSSTLIRLRRLELWHKRMDKLLNDRLVAIQGSSAERELQCKKIISMSTGFSVEQVEQMVGSLLIAMESETQGVDVSRIATFMHKVRDGDTEPTLVPWNLSR